MVLAAAAAVSADFEVQFLDANGDGWSMTVADDPTDCIEATIKSLGVDFTKKLGNAGNFEPDSSTGLSHINATDTEEQAGQQLDEGSSSVYSSCFGTLPEMKRI